MTAPPTNPDLARTGAELAPMSRALLSGFPRGRPEAVALLDVGEHTLTTFVGADLDALRSRLAAYDVIGAIEVRALLRALRFDPGARRLDELGPPQKTWTFPDGDLRITPELLLKSSCGISAPFGDPAQMAGYLADGQLPRLRRRLEADARSLLAMYAYGRLHGHLRLRWAFLDERVAVPWVHGDEPTLDDLMRSALVLDVPLEVVTGAAPGWNDPWSRARLAHVKQDQRGWQRWLVDPYRYQINEAIVQRARLSVAIH